MALNTDMALVNTKGHNERLAVSNNNEIFAVPNTNMLLRERIKRLMGKEIHVSWKSLPEVRSSGLLDTLTNRQIALEELKFCLITCEVVFNTELVELLNLSKQSVSWADPLPRFNRRTIATTIERVKRCSDQFLDAFEKHWNVKPCVSFTVINKILQDLAPQFENYITYCAHQEDLRTVLHTAMRSKHEVVAASFSNRLNLERAMLPLQHLKLYHLLLQDIHSMLISTTNHLDSFHCNRMLSDITKLLEECYKLLAKLHGSQYVENTDRLLDECVHGFEPEPRGDTMSEHQKSFSVDPKIVCAEDSTDSACDTDYATAKECTLLDVNEHRLPFVEEQCRNFDPRIVEKNCRDIVKFSDKCNTVKRQEYVKVCRKKAVDSTLKHRSSQFIRKRCAVFEGGESHNSLYKRQNYYTNSKYSSLQFADISNMTVKDRKRSLSMYETVYRSLGNTGSEKHACYLKNKLNISVNNNKPSYIICGDNNNNNNNNNSSSSNKSSNKPPKSTSLISADSCHLSVSELSRNLTNSGNKSSHAKDVIRESLFHESVKDEKYEISNKLQSSTVQNHSVPSLVLQNNCCQKVVEQCDAVTHLASRLNTPTSTVPSPFKVQHKTIKTHYLEDNLHADRLERESRSCIYKVKIEVQCTLLNEEENCSGHAFSLSNQLYNSGSPRSDRLSSVTKEISYTEELSVDKLCDIQQSPKTEQQIFVSSCDLHCTSTVQLPLQEGSIESDELCSDYKPMNELYRRNCYQFKPGTSSELNKSSNAVYDCGNEYEECKPCDTGDINAGMSKSSMLSTYDVPLYQVYNFARLKVKHSKTKVEENIYVEPDEHIYEEITFYSTPEPESNEKEVSVPTLNISKPAGNTQQLLWVGIKEVADSGMLAEMDAKQVALQEAKYEFITSESSYYKSLLILETVFITSSELTDTAVLQNEDHTALFSTITKVKQCSEKFLGVLLDGWPQDLKLNYLCHAVSMFVSSGSFQVYVDCCGSQIFIDKTLQHLILTNSKFANAVEKLQADPVCKKFSLHSFLILPMQRVTRLPMLVQAILRRLPPDHVEHSVWTDTLVELQKIAEECNEAVGRAEASETDSLNHDVLQPDHTRMSLNMNHLPQERRKKQTRVWKIFGRGRQKIV